MGRRKRFVALRVDYMLAASGALNNNNKILMPLYQIEVILAGLENADPVICSRHVVLVPDMSLEEALKKVKKAACLIF